jgi:hypothetical protein
MAVHGPTKNPVNDSVLRPFEERMNVEKQKES